MREVVNPVRWAREWASSGRLSKPEGDVLKELVSYTGGGEPVAWPCNATLAASVQCVEKTVRRALDGLEEKGLIERARDRAGRVLRSRAHPIVMRVDLAATPAAGQMQLQLGDEALVNADPTHRQRPRPAAAPVTDAMEQARRDELAAKAAPLGAAMAALNASAQPSSGDPGRGTTPPPVVGRPPEVPVKDHVQTEESGRASAPAAPAVNTSGVLSPSLPVVSDALRAVVPEVDLHAMSIDQALRAYPEEKGYDHESAAHVAAAWIAEGGTRGAPTRLLMAALRKQKTAQRPAGRSGGWPPPRRPAGRRGRTAAKPVCAEVERGSALIAEFLAGRPG